MASSKSTQPTSATPASARLPSREQLMALALDKAEDELRRLLKIRCEDDEWSDADVDVDNAVEVALHRVRELQTKAPLSLREFENSWHEIISVLNLSAKAFSRPDTYYLRTLNAVHEFFDVMIDLIEDEALEAQHA